MSVSLKPVKKTEHDMESPLHPIAAQTHQSDPGYPMHDTLREESERKTKTCYRGALLMCILLFIAALAVSAFYGYKYHKLKNDNDKNSSSRRPKNIILTIGDGLGTTINAAYRIYTGVNRTTLDENFVGRYSTRSAHAVVTDSANGAYAFSCGELTTNGYIGVSDAGNPVATILEASKLAGKGTGVVTTSRVTHATPSSFSAHVLLRQWENLIGQQMGTKNENRTWIDVMLGGGKQHFIPQSQNGSKRKDDWDFTESYEDYGWETLVLDKDELAAITDASELPLAGLFADSHLPYYIDRLNAPEYSEIPSLPTMAAKAIDLLSSKYEKKGFFLMIEGARIDMCAHSNDIGCMINEMSEFDEMLQYVYDWAENDGDTLVVTVGDHETGGLTIGRGTSVNADDLVNYYTDTAPRDYDITTHYASFDLNYLIPPDTTDIAYAYIYNWFPDAIRSVQHSAAYMADSALDTAVNGSVSLDSLLYIVSEGLGIDLTDEEIDLLESTLLERDPSFGHIEFENDYVNDWSPVMVHSIGMIMSARSLTGWTTHGHTGADLSVSAYGPSSDVLRGHHTNAWIGRTLSEVFGVRELQEEQTAWLEAEYLEDRLTICDDNYPLDYVEYRHNVSLPDGNLKGSGYMCVTHYL